MGSRLFREALTFDDVLLVPKSSNVKSRSDVDISTELVKGFYLNSPILSANMPAVTDANMAIQMWKNGGYGVLHRFNSIQENVAEYEKVLKDATCAVSVGVKDGYDRYLELFEKGAFIFFVDVAHGHHSEVYNLIRQLKKSRAVPGKIVVGNIATWEAALDLAAVGVDAIKIGIGPGAACSTREVTGFGVPQLTAIMDISEQIRARFPDVRIIADGGIKNSGDIVKALAAGADTVMIGSLLAGCDEAPYPGLYYGNASKFMNGHYAPEGVYGHIERTGPLKNMMKKLTWGIKSGISYSGGHNIEQLRKRAEFVKVTPQSLIESRTRI